MHVNRILKSQIGDLRLVWILFKEKKKEIDPTNTYLSKPES